MIGEVARREIVTRARSKAYRISTLVLLVATVLLVAGAILLGGDESATPEPTEVTIGLTSPDPALESASDSVADTRVRFEFTTLGDDDAVAEALSSGDVDAAVRDGDTLVFQSDPDPGLRSLLTGVLQQVAVDRRAEEFGIDDATLGELLAPAEIDTEVVDPTTDGDAARTVVATIGIFVMFFGIQLYGGQIAMVVVEEKANRIVEILLALVRPRDLLAGKVLGVGVLATIQISIPVVGMFLALALSGTADVPASAYAAIPLLFVFFLLGFTMYGTLFALVGSLVSRQEDAQQALFPVFIPIIAGYALALQAVASPDSLVSTIASVVPLTSPFALPVTVAEGSVGPLLVVASLALLLATTAFMLTFSARVYEFTLLRSGSRIKLGDTLKIARKGSL